MSTISYFNKVGLLVFQFWTPRFVVRTPSTFCLGFETPGRDSILSPDVC